MHLNTVLNKLGLVSLLQNKKIDIVTRKFEDIRSNTIYFAFEEITKKNFEQIRNKGAYLIIGESTFLNNHYIKVDSIKKIYQKYLLWKNKYKLMGKCFIGVTGTSGKSTISTLLYRFLSKKRKTIYFGTDGIYTDNQVFTTLNTTPSMEELFMHLNNQHYVIMEISSISFFEYRLFDIKFDYLLLTNVFEDHLDYHKTKEEYIASKMLILSTNYNAKTFISRDVTDKRFLRLNHNTTYYGFDENKMNFFNIIEHENKLQFDVETYSDYYHVSTSILGKYNVMNIAGVFSILRALNYKMDDIIDFISKTDPIKGRYNLLYYKNKPLIIDYCHTTSSYFAMFNDVKNNYASKLLVIFGAGGNRQESKRVEYSNLVSKYASYAIITNDNPRDEDEMKIASILKDNLTIPNEIILNRHEAIEKALNMINDFDGLLILGKGPENYINIKGKLFHHSDIDTIKEYIR